MRSLVLSSIKYILFPTKKIKKKIKVTILWRVSFVLILVFAAATMLVQKKITVQKEKWSQFECGFNTITPSHIPFSFQFFLIALLFLIFDVEISLVLSYPIEIKSTKTLIIIALFLSILTIGLIYEWQKRKINWSKWMGRISLQENQVCNPNL